MLKILDFPSSISQKSQFWRKKVTPGARQGWIFNGFQEKSQFFSSIQLRVDLSPSSGGVEKNWHSFEGESCMLSILTFLACFEHFKDDFGRSYFFFVDLSSEATHLVTSSELIDNIKKIDETNTARPPNLY